MNPKQQKQILDALTTISEQKGISREEMKLYLEEAFTKAFNKDEVWDWKNPIDEAIVNVNLDMEKGTINITKHRFVVNELNPITRLKEIAINDPIVIEKGLKLGDEYVEQIDLKDLSYSKLQHIKQLLIQKTREAEKNKLFEAFIDKKGKLITAKVFKVEDNYALLDQDGVSIFLPKIEMNPLETLIVGRPILVYVVEVDNLSKDAQIVASRANAQFVSKLIERENEDVADGIVKLEAIAREPGIKTKIAVSSNNPDIDPVSSLIGPKGQKIKVIIDQLNGERIDVISYSPNLKQFIADALAPANIIGIKIYENNEDKKSAVVVVPDDQFLTTLGKRGVNVKLAARLTGLKIDVKKIADAKAEFIDYEPISRTEKSFQKNTSFEDQRQRSTDRAARFSSENYKMSIDDILEGSEDSFDFNQEVYETQYQKNKKIEKEKQDKVFKDDQEPYFEEE